MTGNRQPLDQKFPIVDAQGRPTLYFIKWAQQRQIDIGQGVSESQVAQMISDAFAALEIIGVDEITVTGDYANPPISISWAAGLGDLTDVDLSTPPTDGQVLGWVEADAKWKPQDVASGAGFAWRVTATGTGVSQDIILPYGGLTPEEVFVFGNGLKYSAAEYTIVGTTLTITSNSSGDFLELFGPEGEPAISTQWRLYCTTIDGSTALASIAELYLYTVMGDTGSDIATTGTPTQSTQYSGFGPANFLDRNLGTFSSLNTPPATYLPGWWQVTFATPQEIKGLGIYPRGSELNNSPRDFQLQYFDGGAWVPVLNVTGQTGWTAARRDFFL